MDRVHFETLGCKLNQIETESLARSFRDAGFVIDGTDRDIDDAHGSSVYLPVGTEKPSEQPLLSVINTCTVTGKAEQKARRLIRSILRAWPDSAVLVTGCYAEVEREALASIDPRVVAFPGSRKDELADLPAVLASRLEKNPAERVLSVVSEFAAAPNREAGPFRLSTDDFLFHSRASVKIQDGCDNRCAYCRIRLARGTSVSLQSDDVIARIRDIERAGWSEVVLTGVNLSQYRSAGGDFATLLARALGETERLAFRISSLYPERVDGEMLPILAHPRVRPHFHLSVQSGSDRVLRAMRRPYSASTVRDAVARLREAKDDPFIACDLITGFPGETDADFLETLDLARESRFAWIHSFPFSPRPGTEAWSMRPRVPERVARERAALLGKLAGEGSRAYTNAWIGRTAGAVVERGGTDGSRVLTENYLTLAIPGVCLAPGQAVRVRILDPETAELEN